MNLSITAALLALLGTLAAAAAPATERNWTGTNGRTFRGTFHHLSPDGTKVDFITAQGKPVTVAFANLSKADQELILAPAAPQTPEGGGFKPTPAADRTLIPAVDPKDFGGNTDEPLADALWVSLLWWDQAEVLAIPRKGDFEKKAEWLHKELIRALDKGGRGVASLDDGRKAVQKYVSKKHAEKATCRVSIERNDFSTARLAKLACGADIVLLQMTMPYDNGRDFSVTTALETVTEEGGFVFHVFGKRFHGTIKPDAGGAAEFVLANRGDLPAHYATSGARFLLKKDSWNGALVIEPFLYQTPGKPAPVPASN
jgi:hypothetical protein